VRKWLGVSLLVSVLLIMGGKHAPNNFIGTFSQSASIAPVQMIPQKLRVHYIDVGQGDCILIQTPGNKNILIDTGPSDATQTVLNALKDSGVRTIDILIATHPHEDHIGNMAAVIKAYTVGKIYMPKVAHNTETYANLLRTIRDKGLKVNSAKASVVLDVEKGITAKFLAPNVDSYENLNDYSAVLKLTYGTNNFLFAGDASNLSENEMLNKKYDLKADILKAGHHGSQSSSSATFLEAVAPHQAVISAGANNIYGHPTAQTLAALANIGAKVYRTDLLGTITFTSDGKTYNVDKNTSVQPRAPNTPSPVTGSVYIGNRNSKVFHQPTCKSLPLPKNQITFNTRAAAVAAKYRPCKICKP
jgi:beta-lactamase superfamily II metal-dependent hydrolase